MEWNADLFNKLFLKKKSKEKKNVNNDTSIISWEGISAVNDDGLTGSNFISVDSNYDDLYTDTNFDNSLFASNNLNQEIDESTDDELDINIDLDLDEFDEFNESKWNNDNITDKYNEMENRRKMENDNYENREYTDNKSWKSVFDNPFNISTSMGTFIGDKPSQLENKNTNQTDKKINKDYFDSYKSLVNDKKHKNKKHDNFDD
jgi:hypothetical protein